VGNDEKIQQVLDWSRAASPGSLQTDPGCESGGKRSAALIWIQALLAMFCGSAVGFSLGLIGGGGSILAVPLLLYVVGISDTHVAIGTSALAVSANAFTNLIGHSRQEP